MQDKEDPEPLSTILERFNQQFSEKESGPDKDSKNVESTSSKESSTEASIIALESYDEEDDSDDDYFISKPVHSAFDINLAEFPIAYLNRGRLPKNAKKTEIQYSDTIKGRDGNPIERNWTVEALSTIDRKECEDREKKLGRELTDSEKKLGFGGPQTLEVIYELFQLWKEQGFKDPKIHIGTYYHFLKRLGWCTGKSDYDLLKKTLQCIHGIHIKAENALFLPELDRYENRKFYLFPSLRTYTKHEKELNPKDDFFYITVDEDFYKAVKAKTTYFIPFDRHYFKTLKPMEQKLALMLAKVFTPWKKAQRFQWSWKIDNLANQIPILASNSKHIRMQLKRTCDGLISKDFPFLSKYTIDGDLITVYNNIQTSLSLDLKEEKEKKSYDTVEWLIKQQLDICGDEHSKAFYTLIARHVPVDLIYQALSEAKQEGKIKAKLYTKRILEIGKKYLEPFLKNKKDNAASKDDPTIPKKNNSTEEEQLSEDTLSQKDESLEEGELINISEEEAKLIELELNRDKEEFNKREIISDPAGEDDTDTETE